MFIKIPLEPKHISYLKGNGMLLSGEEVIDSYQAGKGNMNVTLKIKTNKRIFVLKQSRPFVVKFPEVPAPLDRIEIEFKFYNEINKDNLLACFSPAVLGFDKNAWLLAIEHLDKGGDYLWLYENKNSLNREVIDLLLTYLKKLHQLPVTDYSITMSWLPNLARGNRSDRPWFVRDPSRRSRCAGQWDPKPGPHAMFE